MPFLTEELWHFISKRETGEALTVSSWPDQKEFDSQKISDFEVAQEITAGIRNFRKEKNISFKESFPVYQTNGQSKLAFETCIIKLGGVERLHHEKAPEDASGGTFRVNQLEFFIPTLASEDPEAEREKLQTELDYTKGFLASVEKKLANERFVANAPEKVIAIERKKANDAKEKISLLDKRLSQL